MRTFITRYATAHRMRSRWFRRRHRTERGAASRSAASRTSRGALLRPTPRCRAVPSCSRRDYSKGPNRPRTLSSCRWSSAHSPQCCAKRGFRPRVFIPRDHQSDRSAQSHRPPHRPHRRPAEDGPAPHPMPMRCTMSSLTHHVAPLSPKAALPAWIKQAEAAPGVITIVTATRTPASSAALAMHISSAARRSNTIIRRLRSSSPKRLNRRVPPRSSSKSITFPPTTSDLAGAKDSAIKSE